MRLVSEDDVLALLTNHHFDNDRGNFDLLIHNLCNEVRRIPTAYDVNAVVEQLEDLKRKCADPLQEYDPEYFIDRTIEIVKGGGVDD